MIQLCMQLIEDIGVSLLSGDGLQFGPSVDRWIDRWLGR